MKIKHILSLSLLTAMSQMSAISPVVEWETLGNTTADGKPVYTQRITVKNHNGLKRLCFNQFARKMATVDKADSVVEIIPGYYYLTSPRFGEPGGDVVVDVTVSGALRNVCYIPDGLHGVMASGEVVPVEIHRRPMMSQLDKLETKGRQVMLHADSVYRLNERLNEPGQLSPFDVIPSFKSVSVSDRGIFTADKPVTHKRVDNANSEWYRITLTPDSALIEAPGMMAAKLAERVLREQLLPANGGKLPCAVIEDWPDFEYRGMMIDIARNFISYPQMERIVRQMARYRFNRLHFHIVDDEAWRLEIPGLPELTSVGARRGYTTDEHDYLAQLFAGNGDPSTSEGTANGYWTREEFINFIKLCDSLGIAVIPEIESPGHARAAIRSMEARYRRTGDETYRMIEPGDRSVYSSAQSFHDNLMNPALPGTYRFISKVVDEIASMYDDAGVRLEGIHLGGDEVPEGAWDGSESASRMADSLGVTGRHGLQGEYVRKVSKMMADKGIKMYGWQEVGTGYDDAFNKEVSPRIGGVNCWTNTLPGDRNVALRAMRGGFPVILSNVDYFYVDQIYQNHPDERGLSWGGIVDEFRTLHGYPERLCVIDPTAPGRIIGVQGQLFGETLRNMGGVETLLFPKMLGIAERGWNSKPTYSDSRFNRVIGERELPRLATGGSSFHLRGPGIVIEQGMVKMNSPYEGGVIRYTLDGTEPDGSSPVYSAPFEAGDAADIRARLYFLGAESLTQMLPVR